MRRTLGGGGTALFVDKQMEAKWLDTEKEKGLLGRKTCSKVLGDDFLAFWPHKRYVMFLHLSFFIYEMKLVIPTS